TPTATVTATPAGSVCAGTTVTFNAATTNGGSTPLYQWYKNSVAISGATDTTYTYVPANGDSLTFVLLSSLGCASPSLINSAATVMTVTPTTTLSIGDITGTFTTSVGGTTTLSDTTAGGTWSTSAAGVASVDASGVVTGVSAGSAIITYSVTTACATGVDTALITITPSLSGTTLTDTAWAGMTAASATGVSTFATVPAGTTPGSSVVSVSQWNRGAGLNNNTGTGYYNSNTWSTGSIIDSAVLQNKYAYFTITNNATTELKLTKVNIIGQRSSTGPASAQAFYATGSSGNVAFGSVSSVPTTSGNIAFTGNLCIAPGQTDTIKVYGFGATASTGTFRITNGSYISAVYSTVSAALAVGASTNSSPVCSGSAINFTGGTPAGGLTPYSYSWTGGSSFASTIQNP
ncbi:MAG: hypothetical protein EBZ77_16605, partial [Chitinophagia bacterium]|nr:hypothetical protein [Chitinophagia bacterium]